MSVNIDNIGPRLALYSNVNYTKIESSFYVNTAPVAHEYVTLILAHLIQ
jgi:hypothetical protein